MTEKPTLEWMCGPQRTRRERVNPLTWIFWLVLRLLTEDRVGRARMIWLLGSQS
jgi:hypothetical protein